MSLRSDAFRSALEDALTGGAPPPPRAARSPHARAAGAPPREAGERDGGEMDDGEMGEAGEMHGEMAALLAAMDREMQQKRKGADGTR